MSYHKLIIYIALIMLLMVCFFVGILIAHLRIAPQTTINECFIYAPRIPYIPITYVLGTLVDEELYKIIECESDFRPEVCNEEYGCGSGMGLCQIIPSTLRYCEEKLERKLNPFNPQDNLACGIWLYKNEGNQHWDMSRHCWEK